MYSDVVLDKYCYFWYCFVVNFYFVICIFYIYAQTDLLVH